MCDGCLGTSSSSENGRCCASSCAAAAANMAATRRVTWTRHPSPNQPSRPESTPRPTEAPSLRARDARGRRRRRRGGRICSTAAPQCSTAAPRCPPLPHCNRPSRSESTLRPTEAPCLRARDARGPSTQTPAPGRKLGRKIEQQQAKKRKNDNKRRKKGRIALDRWRAASGAREGGGAQGTQSQLARHFL